MHECTCFYGAPRKNFFPFTRKLLFGMLFVHVVVDVFCSRLGIEGVGACKQCPLSEQQEALVPSFSVILTHKSPWFHRLRKQHLMLF